eukprot:313006_1
MLLLLVFVYSIVFTLGRQRSKNEKCLRFHKERNPTKGKGNEYLKICDYFRPDWAGNLRYSYNTISRKQEVSGVILPMIHVSKYRTSGQPYPVNGAITGSTSGYDKGHIFGIFNGGTNNNKNIVGQPVSWQKDGTWKKFEKDLWVTASNLYNRVAGWKSAEYGTIGTKKQPSKLVWIKITISEWQGRNNWYPEYYRGDYRIINSLPNTQPDPLNIARYYDPYKNQMIEARTTFVIEQPLPPKQHYVRWEKDPGILIGDLLRNPKAPGQSVLKKRSRVIQQREERERTNVKKRKLKKKREKRLVDDMALMVIKKKQNAGDEDAMVEDTKKK